MTKLILLEKDVFDELNEKIDTLYKAVITNGNQSSKSNGEWVDTKEAIAMLNVTSRSLQNYRDQGLIGFSKVSKKKIYYRKEDIEKMLTQKYVKPFKTGGENGNR
jgi:hypothetical protein